ncbi:MAG: endonuclease/exonuclease/phosphatase family protein [Trueperaceae bacterium]|nr:endonuclease/exonuclease/phosphatase family protein [Trueperaceae bacterium]
MPSPSSLPGLRPRTPLARRLGAALLLVAIVLTITWALDGGNRGPAGPASASGCAPEAPAAARPVALPLPDAAAWRDLDGALVCLTHPLLVAEVYELPSRGWVLAGAERPKAATSDRALAAGTLRVRPAAADLRNGDALVGAWGTLRLDDRGALLDDAHADPERRNPRPAAPPHVGGDGDVRLAAVNLRNWFWRLGERGAATVPEREAQLAKLIATLVPLDADVLALAEVANDDGRALDELLERVNAAQRALGRPAEAAYAAVSVPAPDRGTDAIRVAIAYRPARLTLVGAAVDRADVHDRPPLAATFDAPNGERFSVVAAHHRSKGGCPTSGDVDRGSGCWDLRRDAQTEALLDFVADLGARVGDVDVLVLGDLNAYRHEAPVRRFADAGWWLAVDAMPENDAYSYVFFGRAGALDHAAASPSAAPRVTGAAFWHVNADEPPGADVERPTPYRASDHDPLVVSFGVGR